MKVKVKKVLDHVELPEYATSGAAGFDLRAAHDVYVHPNGTALVDTGLAFEIPEGYEMQIRPRSGLSAKTKLRVANSPGTIDSDFRGSVKIILDNIYDKNPGGLDSFRIEAGDRIAQGVIVPVIQVEFEEVEELDETERNEGGLGSTGKK